MEYARKLRDDRGRGNIVVVDDGDETNDQMGDHEFEVTDDFHLFSRSCETCLIFFIAGCRLCFFPVLKTKLKTANDEK